MKTVLIIFIILIITVVAVFFALGKQSQKESIPGLSDGKLSKCSTKPNCVCSEDPEDKKHYIEPLQVGAAIDTDKIVSTITEMGGTIVDRTDDYISATFISEKFGFVDDFEIRIDSSDSLFFRSGSRVGYSDRGVNKKRVELFKQIYQK